MSTYFQTGDKACLPTPRLDAGPDQGITSEKYLAYWREKLAGCAEVLALPTDRPRPAHPAFRNGQERLGLHGSLLKKLGALAECEGVTLFEVLFSAYQTLLYRYSGSSNIITGFPALVENVQTLLALRTDFSEELTFSELLEQVHEELRAACRHKISTNLQVFQAVFQCDGPTLGRTEFDLGLEVTTTAGKPSCTLNYNACLFESGTIQCILGHYRTILEAVAVDPGERLSRLPMLTPAERRRMLVEWNNTRSDYPQACVHKLFEKQAERTPEAVALAYEDRRLTYAELNAEANRLAHALSSLGVGPDVMVGICIERSMEMVIGLLAVLKAGGAYAPLDPAHPKERLAFMLSDLQAPVLLCRWKLEGLSGYTGTMLTVDEWPKATSAQSAENPVSPVKRGNLAYVLYTSGSTGQPKGVLIPHRALVNYLAWCTDAYAAKNGRGSPVHTPIGFDLTITSLFPPLLVGRCAVLIPEDQPIEGLTDALRVGDFSLVKLTPAHLEALGHQLAGEQHGNLTRTFVIGGEALLGETLNSWRKLSPGVRLINEYGPTEATVGCCVYEVPAGDIPPATVPIGRPIANVRLYVLDRNLQPVPVGVAGELHIAGDGLALGYHRRPELTAKRFIRDPFSTEPGARLYKTGDLVRYRADGNLEFLGRMDDQVKIRGFRVELSEIEGALVGHGGVREAVVIASESVPGDRRLIAYVVPCRDEALSEAQLRDFLKERLPDYMVPSRFVLLPGLPLTSNGKVDRRALPPPGQRNEVGAPPLDAPRTALEAQMVKLWEEILRTGPIGIKEDFFDLGGNSLLAIRMLSRVGKLVNHNISLATLMNASTIERLSDLLRTPEALARPPVFSLQPHGSKSPFYCVGAGPLFRLLAHKLGTDRPFLGLPLPDVGTLPVPYRMEDMAAYCIETMRERQPQGPYYLGGWSDAGVIAYEMAQQLKRQGEKVGLLVLFDAENPAYLSNIPSVTESARARLLHLGQWLMFQYRTLRSFEFGKAVQYAGRGLAFRVAWLRGKMWSIGYRVHVRSGWKPNHGLHHVEHVSAFVARNYQPEPYEGRVLLLRRKHRPTGDYRDPEYGWGQLAGNLEIHDVAGNHMDIFLEPGVDSVADKLRSALLESSVESSSESSTVDLVKTASANQY